MSKYVDFDKKFLDQLVFGVAITPEGFSIQGHLFEDDPFLRKGLISMLKMVANDLESNMTKMIQEDVLVDENGNVIADAELVYLGTDNDTLN